jgi:ParB-like chromosome segregation protein Spo0J
MADQPHIVRSEPFELSIKDFLSAALKANQGAREELERTDDLSFYIANLDRLPPAIVLWIPEQQRYSLQDGWHRLRTAIHLGRKTFVVVEVSLEQIEAMIIRARLNALQQSFSK